AAQSRGQRRAEVRFFSSRVLAAQAIDRTLRSKLERCVTQKLSRVFLSMIHLCGAKSGVGRFLVLVVLQPEHSQLLLRLLWAPRSRSLSMLRVRPALLSLPLLPLPRSRLWSLTDRQSIAPSYDRR